MRWPDSSRARSSHRRASAPRPPSVRFLALLRGVDLLSRFEKSQGCDPARIRCLCQLRVAEYVPFHAGGIGDVEALDMDPVMNVFKHKLMGIAAERDYTCKKLCFGVLGAQWVSLKMKFDCDDQLCPCRTGARRHRRRSGNGRRWRRPAAHVAERGRPLRPPPPQPRPLPRFPPAAPISTGSWLPDPARHMLPEESEAVFVFASATGGANTATPLCRRMKRSCNARR
jgi:hypothetical protein